MITHTDVCDILLEHNAFVNVRNKIGMTPLHYAGIYRKSLLVICNF